MSGFLTSPTFSPPVGPIALGSNAQVLTMVGGVPAFAAAGGGGGSALLGTRLAFASPAGGAVAAAPAGFTGTTGRLLVTLPGGNATWASLTNGIDGQLLVVANNDAANILTLSAVGFLKSGLILPPGHRGLLYYDATDASWEIANA
jgi:subtilisin family serine protease